MKEGVQQRFIKTLLAKFLPTLLLQALHHSIYLAPVFHAKLQSTVSLCIVHYIRQCHPVRREDAAVFVHVHGVHAEGARDTARVLSSCPTKTCQSVLGSVVPWKSICRLQIKYMITELHGSHFNGFVFTMTLNYYKQALCEDNANKTNELINQRS